MKRFGMMMVACLMAANLFAVGNQPTTEKEKFNVNINVTKLSNYLKLNGNQKEEVTNICTYFNDQMYRASSSHKNQKKLLQQAVYGNLKLMKETLNEQQYNQYVRLLNVTLHNRGIAMD